MLWTALLYGFAAFGVISLVVIIIAVIMLFKSFTIEDDFFDYPHSAQ